TSRLEICLRSVSPWFRPARASRAGAPDGEEIANENYTTRDADSDRSGADDRRAWRANPKRRMLGVRQVTLTGMVTVHKVDFGPGEPAWWSGSFPLLTLDRSIC